MNWNNLTIGKKIAAGFGITLFLMGAVGLLSYSGVGSIVKNAEEVIDGNKLDANLAQKEVDHLNWAGKINALLTDENIRELNVQTDDHKCGFGEWLYAEGRRDAESLVPSLVPLFKEIEQPHARLHASALEIKKYFQQVDEHLPQFIVEKKVDHLLWIAKIKDLFLKNLDKLDVNSDPHRCGFGKFLYGEAGGKAAASDPELARLLEEIKEPHARLHDSAAKIAKAWRQTHPGLINSLMARLDDHRKWAAVVASALISNKKINVEQDPSKCAFGRWLNSSECKGLSVGWPEFADSILQVRVHHTNLHRTVNKIMNAKSHAARVRIFERETSMELAAVAGYFDELIALEEKNEEGGRQAEHIFTTETLPALEETQIILGKIAHRAERMLDGAKHARQIYAGKTLPALVQTQKILGQIRKEAKRNIMTDAIMLKAAQGTKRNVTIAVLATLLLGISLAFIIARGITGVLHRITLNMDEGANQVASAAGQVSSASQQLAEGASEQAAGIEETSSSMEEMASMTRRNAENAGQADISMKEVSKVVSNANDSMTRLICAMEEISKASDETQKVVKTIDEIAFQTNLLALNAAVEAARAGEAGAGFAVVAEEVRNLALRSAEAAKNTAELIDGTVKKIGEGSELANKTNDEFVEVAESSSKVGELVGEISAASGEQSQGIEQVNKAVVEMDTVVQQNAASAEESASASEELNAQAEQVKCMVGELAAMVGGAKKTVQHYSAQGVLKSPASPGHQHTIAGPVKKIAKKHLAGHKAQEVDFKKVIPMDDDDFSDF